MTLSIIFLVIAWVFEALEELTVHKPEVFDKWPKPNGKIDFYNSEESWKFKYRWKYNGRYLSVKADYPAFPGSKTWLVWLVDGFHLFKMIKVVSINIAFTSALSLEWYWYFAFHLGYFVIFELFYNRFKLRK